MRSMILALAGVGGLLLAADASAEDYTLVAGSLTDAASGESQPLTGDLQVRGPYRISRNPQYVGAVGVLAGLALLSNSFTVLLAVVPWCLWFWLAPLAEEPWLRALLGDSYISYAARTKRYL